MQGNDRMHAVYNQMLLTLRWALRDRVFHAVLGVALFLFLLVPSFSLFSMRQVQELSMTMALSAESMVLLVLATLLGSSSVWRDIERRYTASLLSLPVSRAAYILGKFSGIALFIAACAAFLGMVAAAVVYISSVGHPSDTPIHWLNLAAAVGVDALKYLLLAACALLLSTLSTSFFLPFFVTLAVYFCGSASQEVYEYISGSFGANIPPPLLVLMKGIYYLIPNFSVFDLKLQAIYGLPVPFSGLILTLLYFGVYTAILLFLAIWIFSRRELS